MIQARWLLPFALVLAIGCAKPADAPSTENGASAKESEAAGGQNGAEPKSAEKTAAPVPTPDNLKNDAYAYYGLGNDKPLSMEIKFSTGSQSLTGEQTITALPVEDGKARFEMKRTGGLAALGGVTLLLKDDGLYVEKLENGELPKPSLEMPAKLAPGSTWSNDGEFTLSGKKMKDKSSYKVVGEETVKVKAGTFKAMVVEGKGDLVEDGVASKTSTKLWFVKDVGAVKMEIKRTLNGETTTVSVEATSVGGTQP